MSTRRGSRYTRRPRGKRPRYIWHDRQNASNTTVAAGGQAIVNLLSQLVEGLVGITIVRMFLNVNVGAAQANARIEYAHGVIPLDEDAFAAGAVPDPGQDQRNWYVFEAGMFRSGANQADNEQILRYDIRSARRIGDENVILLHSMLNNSASESLNYSVASRLLIRLP